MSIPKPLRTTNLEPGDICCVTAPSAIALHVRWARFYSLLLEMGQGLSRKTLVRRGLQVRRRIGRLILCSNLSNGDLSGHVYKQKRADRSQERHDEVAHDKDGDK
jgi:hypothetical protein